MTGVMMIILTLLLPSSMVSSEIIKIGALVPMTVKDPQARGLAGARYWAQANQAMIDIRSGLIELNPPLPDSVSVQLLQYDTRIIPMYAVNQTVNACQV
jgi:hypothetical protein